MKKTLTAVLAGLVVTACLGGTAQAAKGPVIYDQARAIPTKSGKNVRITVYTKRVKRIKVSVNDSRRLRGTRFGTGCGKLRCQKWKVYAVRTGNECYELGISVRGRLGKSSAAATITACEPFRKGRV